MTLRKFSTSMLLASLLWPASFQALSAETLLTGIITSARNQVVTAPRTNRSQVQIQWMADEGSIVKEGELVAVFDSGGLESQLEENEQRLVTESLELLKIETDLQQEVVEAEGRLALAEIMVEKTRIEASVPDGEISAYEKGKHQIEYEKALMEKIKAAENLRLKQAEQAVGVDKQKIEIVKIQENIDYQRSQLGKLSVKAEVSGPVTHMMHPWQQEKITIGMNVQSSWNVLMVQAQSAYQVSAWIHELDAAGLAIRDGQFSLALDAYPEQRFQGKLLSLSSQAEQKKEWSDSAYYRLEIGFEQLPPYPIFPGMSVRVRLAAQPQLALQQEVTDAE